MAAAATAAGWQGRRRRRRRCLKWRKAFLLRHISYGNILVMAYQLWRCLKWRKALLLRLDLQPRHVVNARHAAHVRECTGAGACVRQCRASVRAPVRASVRRSVGPAARLCVCVPDDHTHLQLTGLPCRPSAVQNILALTLNASTAEHTEQPCPPSSTDRCSCRTAYGTYSPVSAI